MKESRSIMVGGLLLAGVKLSLLPLQAALPASSLSAWSDCALNLLMAFAAWRASRRSHGFARSLWLGTFFFLALEVFDFGVKALTPVLASKNADSYWPLPIIYYLIAATFSFLLLLREDIETPALSWLQSLDVAQLGILTLAAYLAFFFIPARNGISLDLRAHRFMVLHLARDGFFVLGFAYRGWRSRFPNLRRLHFRFAAFFLAYAAAATLNRYAVNFWHWPPRLMEFVFDLPALFLLWTAVSWRQGSGAWPPAQAPQPEQGRVWGLVFPLVIPLSVIALASRIAGAYPAVAWTAITLSFVCYAGRLLVMQSYQDAAIAQLIATEDKFARVFKASPASVALVRASDGAYVEVNDRWLQGMELKREQVIGKTPEELGFLMNPADRKKMMEQVRQEGAIRGQNIQFSYKGRVIDTLHTAEMTVLHGEPMMITTALDITEFKSVIHQLHHAQKMQLVGTLAGGVAHDFNNLLTVITGYAVLALNRGLDADLQEEIGQIKEAAAKAAALTRQLLAFSRRQVLEPRNINLNQTITVLEKLLRRTIGENITLRASLAADLGTVHADPVQMEQVLMNLAVNARDAMPGGGKLLFETKSFDLTAPYPQNDFEIPPGRYVMLAITDTGAGILPEHMDRIFEPFFTTKGAGKGTGLGLSTVYGIVKQSGGYIWAYSHPGTGTTFKVCLPAVNAPPDAAKPGPAAEDLTGTETVMVVDDDPRVRELTAKVLRQYGYQVLTSESGEDALQQAEQFAAPIDLLVTDVIMSQMNGWELAQHLKAKRPQLKLLYLSGYAQFPERAGNSLNGSEPTLHKPFDPRDLAFQVRKVLRTL